MTFWVRKDLGFGKKRNRFLQRGKGILFIYLFIFSGGGGDVELFLGLVLAL